MQIAELAIDKHFLVAALPLKLIGNYDLGRLPTRQPLSSPILP
jgi:hypothetical protein